MITTIRVTLTAILAIMLLAGCSQNTMSELDMPKPAEHIHKPSLDVQIETSGRTAIITVTTDMKISEEHIGQARKPGEGHIHLYLDNGKKISVISNKYIIKDLEPGVHTVKISLHNNDHTPYDVAKQLKFEIKP
jgi:hypothetical protein